MKKINIIPIVFLVVGLLVGASAVYLINQGVGQGAISIEEARERMLDAMSRLLSPEANASITDIVAENGLYKITVNIQGQEEVVYLTKSGILLFPEVINLDTLLASPAPTPEGPQQTFTPEQLTGLANCLTGKEVRFFGTAECPWCIRQKELFGEAAEFLPYIECTPGIATEQEIAMCEEANVGGVPDWRFPGQEPVTGMQSIERIAELSGCPI